MDPLLSRLEKETGLTFRRFEVWYNLDNLKLLQTLDQHNACGGVPYFYNKKTRGWICGATTYANFKAFATGKAHEHFLSPPVSGDDENGGGGFVSQFRGFFDKIKSQGLQKIKERFEAGKEKAGEKVDTTGSVQGAGAFTYCGQGCGRLSVGNQVARIRLPGRGVTDRRPPALMNRDSTTRYMTHSMGQPF